MGTVEDALQGHDNNFDVLRLLAALIVLWSHSFPLTGHGSEDFLTNSLFGYDLAGAFAVLIFFVISGFLVTKSAQERSIDGYLTARALRILPALVCTVVITVFLIGPLMTKLRFDEYLAAPFTLSYLANMFVFGIQHDLPAATAGLPYTAMNSSLWTLSVECAFYLVLAVLASFGLLTRQRAGWFVLAMVAFHVFCFYWLGLFYGKQGPVVWQGATLHEIAKNGCAFALGGAFWVYRDKVPLNPWLAAACGVALYAAFGTMSAAFVYALALPYLVIFFALRLPAVSLRRLGDLSYGTYLISFPIQQLVISRIGTWSPTAVSLITMAIVLPVAYASWWYIEKPFLTFKARRARRLAVPSMQHQDTR